MEVAVHYLKIVRHMYRLEKEDLIYVTDSATSFLNWTVPAFIFGWMTKRLYLMERQEVRLPVRISLFLLPLVCPCASVAALYFLYFKDDPRLPGLMVKYPLDYNFLSREKDNFIRKTEDKNT